MSRRPPLGGAFAAAATPLTPDGDGLDTVAIGPLVDWLCTTGLDGLLVLGTTGEGVLLDVDERRRAVEAFVAAARGRLRVLAQCGAQSTRDTATLAACAAAAGADAVAVIAPPYFALDEGSMVEHLGRAADACAPLPFFVYEFATRSGYAVPPSVLGELRSRATNLAGLKVSDSPWERFAPYLLEGLDVFVGPEALIHRGMAAGAVGAVSGLAAALPEVVVEAVRSGTAATTQRAEDLRARIDRFPFHAAIKRLLVRRGVLVHDAVRAPLRGLSTLEGAAFDAMLPELLADAGVPVPAPSA